MTALFILVGSSPGFAQGDGNPPAGARTRGQITAIQGNQIDISRRDGSTTTIVTTGNTTFQFNGEPATLEDFEVGDFVRARGQQNGNGAFVADGVRGTDRQPGGGGQGARIEGSVTAVDAVEGSITVTTQEGGAVVVYTTAGTTILRNRQPATVADFQSGDRLRANGERDPNGAFVAERILGGSGPAQ